MRIVTPYLGILAPTFLKVYHLRYGYFLQKLSQVTLKLERGKTLIKSVEMM